MARRPGALVHDEHRAHEHVTAEGKHNDEGPDPAHPLANGVEPLPGIAVVDLGLFARRDVRARRTATLRRFSSGNSRQRYWRKLEMPTPSPCSSRRR